MLNSIFDILGPIMIGPSSSHTAGAVRIGRVARMIADGCIKKAVFYLHGSFANTYKGHGTDKALMAGILGMETDDERIKESLTLAEEMGICVEFIETDLGDVHPNTVKIVIVKTVGTEISVLGASIGGGEILITKINDDEVEYNGKYPLLIVKHKDIHGMISNITGVVADCGINIATLKVGRQAKGEVAATFIETDTIVPEKAVEKISRINGVNSVRKIDALGGRYV